MRNNKIALVGALIGISALVAFQNCSQLGSKGLGRPADQQNLSGNSMSSGGTSTDNPLTATVSVNTAQFSVDVQVGLCINGSQFLTGGVKASSLRERTIASPRAPLPGPVPTPYFDLGGLSALLNSYKQEMANLQELMSQPLDISSLLPGGMTLGVQEVQYGAYSRIELQTSASCPSGFSIQVTNRNGTFSTTAPLSLAFVGALNVDGTANQVYLDISSHLQNLSQITANDQIRSAVESALGQAAQMP